jgi:hypothetical protein
MVPLKHATAERADCRGDHWKEGGPSRDWLNPELHFNQRSRYPRYAPGSTDAADCKGREAVEKVVAARRNATNRRLIGRLGFGAAEDPFEMVGSRTVLRTIENLLRPELIQVNEDAHLASSVAQRDRHHHGKSDKSGGAGGGIVNC